MSNPLELPFGSPQGKVQDPLQSPEDGHEQSPTHVSVGFGDDLPLLFQRSLVAALAIATVAGGGFSGVLLGSPLLLYQQ